MAVPFTPQSVVLQTGNGQNFLTWSIVAGATSYKVQRSTDGVIFTALGTSATTTYLDAAPTLGTNYFYQVAATNGSGDSTYTASSPTNIVACAPGQINLGYLRYQAQLRADKLGSQYLTQDEWDFNANQAVYELYDILVTKYGDDYFMAPPLQIPLTGLSSYTLPDGILYSAAPAMFKLLGVDVNTNGITTGPNAGWQPLARIQWSDRNKYNLAGGQPYPFYNFGQMSYRQMGNQLYIFPQNINQTLQLWYTPRMTQLLQDTDMLAFSISGWSEYVILRMALLAMSKEESSEKYALINSQIQVQLERIETTAANRDSGQPNTVSNVRGTMGDPGFGGYGNGMGGNNSGGGWW